MFANCVIAQDYGPFHFDQLPADQQLFARRENNLGEITVAGRVHMSEFKAISIVKLRSNVINGYQRSTLAYQNGNDATFDIKTLLKAELAEYSLVIYGLKSDKDSVLLVRRDNLVAGDFYLIYGQSNAVAWEVDYQYRNEFCRSYGVIPETGQNWGLANTVIPRSGTFGIEFQKQIAEKYQIPTCVINGAVSGASIEYLTQRTAADHADQSNAYGRTLHMAQQSGLLPWLKAIVYWQGETEAASSDPLTWAPSFDRLMAQWKEDYPMIQKIYLFQLPLFGGSHYEDRVGVLREKQRTMNLKYPIVEPYGALGAPGWNGFHYGEVEGYLKLGEELSVMAGYYHYGEKEKITSPSFQKAFYSNASHDEVTMVFEDYQEMVYPNDTIADNIEGTIPPKSVSSLKDFFYLNNTWQKVKAGRADGNRIILTLKEPGQDTTIKYLPSVYPYVGLQTAPWVYIGPFLKNTNGFRAMAFHYNKIYPYENLGEIKIAVHDADNKVMINWNKLQNISGYILDIIDRQGATETHEVVYLTKDDDQYIYSGARKGVNNTYRIRAYTNNTETNISSLDFIKGGEDEGLTENWKIYPNPAFEYIKVESQRDKIDEIEVLNASGVILRKKSYPRQPAADFNVSKLSPGNYFLRISAGNKKIVRQIIIAK